MRTDLQAADQAAGARGAGDPWDEVRGLMDLGLLLAAHRKVLALGGYRAQTDERARVVVGRLAGHLGAPRLGDALFVLAHRHSPQHAEAAYFHHYVVSRRRGPYEAYRYLVGWGEPSAAQPEARACWWSALARQLALLRDFERGASFMGLALDERPDDPWMHVVHALVLELEDRMADAEAAVDRALALSPTFRSAVLAKAHCRSEAGDIDGALTVLTPTRTAESLWGSFERARLLLAKERPAEALDALKTASAASPLLERRVRMTLSRKMAEAAYLAGDWALAREQASIGDSPFDRGFAERLEGGGAANGRPGAPPAGQPASPSAEGPGGAPSRIRLPVPYIRQHHVTCAPATLASIALYYGEPVDHHELAERICYAGTPSQLERSWAEESGHIAREFDVTEAAARALLERGHPFTLVTRTDISAHLQAVVGFDSLRRSLLVRDPGVPFLQELDLDALLASHACNGPRGMTLVPRERASEIEGVELPGEAAWDLDFAVRRALDAHDREAAEAALGRLQEEHPDHHLTSSAEASYAGYRGDVPAELAIVERSLSGSPGVPSLLARKACLLRQVETREACLAWFASLGPTAPPSVLQQWADTLLTDAPRWPEAERLLRRIVRVLPTVGLGYHVLADLETTRCRDDEVLDLYRFAACLEPANEHFARALYDCAARLGRADEARAFLERRVSGARGRSSEPAQTLFDVYLTDGRPELGLDVLERVAELRPSDGELLLECARAHVIMGRLVEARRCLERAEGACAPGAWQASAARIADAEGQTARAVSHYRAAIELLPHQGGLAVELSQLLAEQHGPEAAVAELEAALDRSRSAHAVVTALAGHIRYDDPPAVARLLEKHLARHPDDAWCRRELALTFDRMGQAERALSTIEDSLRWLPQDAVALSIRGSFRLGAGDAEGAAEDLRAALRVQVDLPMAIAELVGMPQGGPEAVAALELVFEELGRQQSTGAAIDAFGSVDHVLSREAAVTKAEGLAELYPRLPEALILRSERLADAGRTDEAWVHIEAAVAAFPHVLSLWRARARIAFRRQDLPEEERSLARAVSLAPRSVPIRAGWASNLADQGRVDEALELLSQGLALAPRDGALLGTIATLRHRKGEHEQAIELMKDAVRVAPGHGPNWHRLVDWLAAMGRREEAIGLARELLAARPTWALLHHRLAEAMWAIDHLEERVAALESALRLNPRYLEAADLLMTALAQAGRYDEALASCPPAGWKGPVPVELLGRKAWVLAARGDVRDAITAMEQACDQAPGYAFGLERLLWWHQHLEDQEGRLAAAKRYAREVPMSSRAHAELGRALLARGQPELGRTALERALSLSPGDFVAASEMVRLHLEDGAIGQARAVLEAAQPSIATDEACALAAAIAAAARDAETAKAALVQLCALPTYAERINGAVDALSAAGMHQALTEALETALFAPECHVPVVVGQAWRDRLGPLSAFFAVLRLLRRMGELGPAAFGAIAVVVEELGELRARLRLGVLWVLHRAKLARYESLWGSTGFALHGVRAYRRCASFMADYRERRGARPWMLVNLVSVLWGLGRIDEANAVAAHALGLVPDHGSFHHRQWLSLGLAARGDLEGARRTLEVDRGLEPKGPDALVRAAAKLAASAVSASRDELAPEAVAEEARELLAMFETLGPTRRPEVQKAYRVAMWLARPHLPFRQRLTMLFVGEPF